MKSIVTRAVTLCLLLGATTVFLANARRAEVAVTRESFASFPRDIDGWKSIVDPPMEEAILKVLGVDDYLSRVYFKPDGAAIGLYMGFYGSQRQGDTIHSPLNCLPGAGWLPVDQGRATLTVKDGTSTGERQIEVNRVLIERGLDRQLVFYWYQSHGRVVASEYWGKIYTVVDAIRHNRTDAALVRVIAPIPSRDTDALAAADTAARAFVQALFPHLGHHLPS
jgi:EpsI family protein